jgi:hypothetical protein
MDIVPRMVIKLSKNIEHHPMLRLVGAKIIQKEYVIHYTARGWTWQTMEGYLRELEAKQ